MKPVLEKLPLEQEESFFIQAFDLPYFGTPWHYHPEYELVYIAESEGKRFIGNSVGDFKKGELFFIGPHLPHLFRNPPSYYEKKKSQRARSVVIHFTELSIGHDFFLLPQTKKLAAFLEASKQGLDIFGATRKKVIRKMYAMLKSSGMQRLIYLLEILYILSDSKEFKSISEAGIIGHNSFDADRLNKVFQFILQNFRQRIRLDDVAALVYMTKTSFCRFFLERTKRTFSDYLAEVRLNYATRLLSEKNFKVASIAFESGYNNLSNFNRQFKEKYKMSPQKYKQLIQLKHLSNVEHQLGL